MFVKILNLKIKGKMRIHKTFRFAKAKEGKEITKSVNEHGNKYNIKILICDALRIST